MNDQDPLSQLRDIHLPDGIGFWPPAPGWWIVAALILALAIFGLLWRHRQIQLNRYRSEAAGDLETAWQQYTRDNDGNTYLLRLTQLLKRTALTAYPAIGVNRFQGRDWLAFLDDTSPTKGFEFLDGPGTQLLELPYRQITGDVDLKPLHEISLRWLKEHRGQSVVIKPDFRAKSQTSLSQTAFPRNALSPHSDSRTDGGSTNVAA